MSLEQKEESRYIRELKKQIQKLKKENQQLRKAKRIFESTFINIDSDIDTEMKKDFNKMSKQKQKTSDKNKENKTCPKCKSEDIFIFELRDLPYYRCSECQSKGKLK